MRGWRSPVLVLVVVDGAVLVGGVRLVGLRRQPPPRGVLGGAYRRVLLDRVGLRRLDRSGRPFRPGGGRRGVPLLGDVRLGNLEVAHQPSRSGRSAAASDSYAGSNASPNVGKACTTSASTATGTPARMATVTSASQSSACGPTAAAPTSRPVSRSSYSSTRPAASASRAARAVSARSMSAVTSVRPSRAAASGVSPTATTGGSV